MANGKFKCEVSAKYVKINRRVEVDKMRVATLPQSNGGDCSCPNESALVPPEPEGNEKTEGRNRRVERKWCSLAERKNM